MRLQTSLSIGLSELCTFLSLLHDPEAFWAFSGEVSIFCNSPSSRSESAMLSMESSKCICDWKLDVSDVLESGELAVPISLQIPPLLR